MGWAKSIAEGSLPRWLEEHCDKAVQHRCKSSELHAAYVADMAAESSYDAHVSLHAFTTALRLLGYPSARLGGSRVWFGLRLKPAHS